MVDVRPLPPGQRRVEGFPRFGAHLSRPAPPVPARPVIAVRGAVNEGIDLTSATLSRLPRAEVAADFHCVAGWSATGLRWEGVPFASLYRTLIEPALPSGTTVTHVRCRGLDGWRSVMLIEDALAGDVLIAEHLDGLPLDGDHGAPFRLVSPSQYGYISVKHLCRIDVLTAAPRRAEPTLLRTHPRARVRHEERHGLLPGRLVRPVYRSLIGPIRVLCGRGSAGGTRPTGSG